MARKDDLGRAGEDRAASYLRDRGYEILDRNWRCQDGEIDIVAVRGDRVVAVEVKTRSGIAYGHPFSAIDDIKLGRMWRLALAWAAANPDVARRHRISVDAIAIVGRDPRSGTLEHLEGLR